MFENNDAKKRTHEAAYGKGKGKARRTGAVEGFVDGMTSLILPDSLGAKEYQSYREGYHDGAGSGADRPQSAPEQPLTLDASEKAWYGLCNSSDFIPEEIVNRYQQALTARGHQVAYIVGLSDFTAHVCPRCGARGQFEIHFLGSLRHSECEWSGYMRTSSYIAHQIAQTFHTGARAAGGMKEQADRKGERHTWVNGVFGFLFASVFRAVAAVVIIPLHCVVALFDAGQSKSDVIARVAALAVIATTVGIAAYAVTHGWQPGSQIQGRVPTAATGRSYTVSVTAKNGRQTVTLTEGGKTVRLAPDKIDRYVAMFYNRPHDILGVACPTVSQLRDLRSSTSNPIDTRAIPGFGRIEIFKGRPNNLTITCGKQ